MPQAALHPVHQAIAKSEEALLRAAMAQCPTWQSDVEEGRACWSRVVTDKDRSHLWPVLVEHGITHQTPVPYKGGVRPVLSLAVEFGCLNLIHTLLNQGADPNVWVKRRGRSAIEVLTQRWCAFKDLHEEKGLLDLVERFAALGAEVSPSVLNRWVTYAGYRRAKRLDQSDRLRVLIQKAWDQGVRPLCDEDANQKGVSEAIAPLHAALVLMLHVGDEGARAMLSEVLKANPPTPVWGRVVLDEMNRNPILACTHFPAVLEVVRQSWPTQSLDWPSEVVGGWKSRFTQHSAKPHQIKARAGHQLEMLRWALDNGLPVEHLVQAPRAFVPAMLDLPLLAAFAEPAFPLEVLKLAFEHEQWLSTGLESKRSLEQHLADLANTSSGLPTFNREFAQEFWQRHGPTGRALESHLKATRLEGAWQTSVARPCVVRF